MALPELIANSPTPGSNVPITTLAAAITTTGATTITTAAAAPAALQAAGQFRIVVDSEIMLVTAGASGTTWTVTRGAETEGPAATHLNGAGVYHYLTAGAALALLAYYAASGGTVITTNQVAANSVMSNYLLAADANPAFSIKGDGTHSWGPGGSAAKDVTLSRTAPGQLMLTSAVGSGTQQLAVWNQAASGFGGSVIAAFTTQAAGTGFIFFNCLANSVSSMYVRGDGHIYSTSTTITSTSDQALKDDIKPLEGALTAIRALKPRSFTWNDHAVNAARAGQEEYGLIAQEVEQVLPHLVGDDFQWKDGEDPLKSFRMGDLVPWLVGAVQEMAAKIDALEATRA